MKNQEEIKKEVKAYLKPAKKRLLCSKESRRTFYEALVSSADELFGVNPNATREQLHKYLGSPEALVGNFVEGLDEEEVTRARRREKLLLIGGITLAAVVVIAAFYLIVVNNTTDIGINYLDKLNGGL